MTPHTGCLLCFLRTRSQYVAPYQPETHYVEYTEICLPLLLLPECWDEKHDLRIYESVIYLTLLPTF